MSPWDNTTCTGPGEPDRTRPGRPHPELGAAADTKRRDGALTWPSTSRFTSVRRRVRAFVTLLTVIALTVWGMSGAGPASADTPTTCVTNPDGTFVCTGPPITVDPGGPSNAAELLNATLLTPGTAAAGGLYATATAAQLASLRVLEQQAVTNTAADHGVGPADAVQTWGRSDAEGELWALLVQAVQAPTRTTDQQNVSDWLAAMVARQGIRDANNAGAEYVKWAGLDPNAYNALIATPTPSRADLNTVLSPTPLPFNTADSSKATGGYCAYRSPAPFQDEYTSYIGGSTTPPNCVAPCPSVLGCPPPTPTYDQFVTWGDADSSAFINNADFAGRARNYALGATLAATYATAVAPVAGAGSAAALAPVLGGSAFQLSVFTFAARASDVTISEAIAAAVSAGEDAAAAQVGVEAAAEEVGGAVAATGVGAIISAVIFAVTTAVQVGISVTDAANLPDKLAGLVSGARTATPDVKALAGGTGIQGMYSLFVGATGPTPFTASGCSAIVISGTTGVTPPCLNAPAIPAATATDPVFTVTPRSAGAKLTQQPALTWTDTAAGIATTARLSGVWFVDTLTVGGTASTIQTLRLHYTDWSGTENTAWLFDNSSTYRFLSVADSALGAGFDPKTCTSAGTCAYTATVPMLDGNGQDITVGVSAPAPTITAPAATALQATYGQAYSLALTADGPAATFTATGLSPGLTISAGGQITGTPTATGSYPVTATATNAAGPGTLPFTITVAPAALTITAKDKTTSFGAAAPAFDTSVDGLRLTDTAAVLSPFTCTAVDHAGAPVSATTPPGTYPITCSAATAANYTVTDVPGTLTVGKAATTTALAATTTAPVVGQPETFTATVTTPPGVPATGTVTFTDGTTPVCTAVALPAASPFTATCRQTYPATGQHPVTATYNGDADTATSPSSPLTVAVGKASVTVALSDSIAAPQFGQTLTFGSAVTAAPPSTAGPAVTGTVSYTLDGAPLGSAAVLGGGRTVSVPVTGLAPGAHTVTATYSGDGAYTASTTSLSVTVGCAQTITGNRTGPLTVTGSLCIVGGSVSGPVTVGSGGALALVGATVTGPVKTTGATAVRMCGSTITGPVSITGTTGPVQLGGPTGSPCTPDTFRGPVTVTGTTGHTTLANSSVVGPTTLTGNAGGVSVQGNTNAGPVTVATNTGTAPVTVGANSSTGPLACSGNTPAPDDAGTVNHASTATGQCATLV